MAGSNIKKNESESPWPRPKLFDGLDRSAMGPDAGTER